MDTSNTVNHTTPAAAPARTVGQFFSSITAKVKDTVSALFQARQATTSPPPMALSTLQHDHNLFSQHVSELEGEIAELQDSITDFESIQTPLGLNIPKSIKYKQGFIDGATQDLSDWKRDSADIEARIETSRATGQEAELSEALEDRTAFNEMVGALKAEVQEAQDAINTYKSLKTTLGMDIPRSIAYQQGRIESINADLTEARETAAGMQAQIAAN